jgi:hypothetical protein
MKLKKEISSSKVEDRIIIISYKIEGLIHSWSEYQKEQYCMIKEEMTKKRPTIIFDHTLKVFAFCKSAELTTHTDYTVFSIVDKY